MRIELTDRTGLNGGEADKARELAAWFVTYQNPDPNTRATLPWVAHELRSEAQADEKAAGLVVRYPDMPAWVFGIPSDGGEGPILATVHVADTEPAALPDERETALALGRTRERLAYLNDRTARQVRQGATAAGGPPADAAPAGPDLSDHLYRNKSQVGPDAKRDGGDDQGGDDQGEQLAELRTEDGRRLADTPRPGEGGES